MNNSNLARSNYEELLRTWQQADELPPLNDAKRELKKLTVQGLMQ
jgi:hypothetical protein